MHLYAGLHVFTVHVLQLDAKFYVLVNWHRISLYEI